MNTEKFILYESVYKTAAKLAKRDEKKAWDYIKAVMEYGLYGIEPDEDDDVWLYGLDSSFASIGAAQKRYDKAIENGKKGGRPQKCTVEQAVAAKAQGLTNKEIAEKYGCSERTIENKLREARLKESSYEKTEKTIEISEISSENLNKNINNNNNNNTFEPHNLTFENQMKSYGY